VACRCMPADRIQVLIGLANHDSAEFEDPPVANFGPPDQSAHRLCRRSASVPGFTPGSPRVGGGARGVAQGHPRLPDRPHTKLFYDGGGVFAIDNLPLEWTV